jgi:uncharacterized damage-inducible protein DinB
LIDLIDIHERSHRNWRGLMDHCATLSADEYNREFESFGYPTVRLQLHHTFSAESYWVGVLEGRKDFEYDDAAFNDITSLAALRERVVGISQAYLRSTSPETLSEARPFVTWGGKEQVLIPAQVIMRTITHGYHHMGLIVTLCRLLGRPGEGWNYPIT